MATDRHNEDDSRSLARCAACNATVIAQIDCREPVDANTVCATCGMTIFDSPLQSDYFEVAMKIHRRGPAPRPRRS